MHPTFSNVITKWVVVFLSVNVITMFWDSGFLLPTLPICPIYQCVTILT